MTTPILLVATVAVLLSFLGLATTFAKSPWRAVKPQTKKPRNLTTPNWSTIQNYADLSDLVQGYHFPSEDAFLGGPFQRYLELASDPRQSPRASARIMEFCRDSLNGFATNHSDNIQGRDALNARARNIAEAWFAAKPHGEYMLEVLDGISNHNFRGSYD